jgi:spermidine synthase
MIPWEYLESAPVPEGDGELSLYRRGGEFSIRLAGRELMNSRLHGSEEALAELSCARIAGRPRPRLLIGGLGMGFTLAAALRRLPPEARVVVAELVPAVVAWNRGVLAELAGRPLLDSRVRVHQGDVAECLRPGQPPCDAILLDVDNGPEALARTANNWLYARPGLEAARQTLTPGGVLAVWSAAPHQSFSRRLRHAGFAVDERQASARGPRGGRRHTIWLATPASTAPAPHHREY